MKLLQVKIDKNLDTAIQSKAKKYGITASSLVRIVLVKSFMEEEKMGNIFNADRDNNGVGIKIEDLIAKL